MVARIVLIVLFPVAWPIYFGIWCRRHPEEVRHTLRSVRDLIRRHPKRAAWLGVVFGGIGTVGHLADGELPAMLLGAAVAGWCGWLLVRWRRRELAEEKAAVTAEETAPAEADAAGEDEAGSPVGEHDLFVYGTLQFPRVLCELIGRSPESVPTAARGWRVAALPGRIYPGLIPESGEVARGLLLTGLDQREWAVLDAFEDEEYELRALETEAGPALTYVWTAEVAAQDWRPADFAATHLDSFVTECEQWRAAS